MRHPRHWASEHNHNDTWSFYFHNRCLGLRLSLFERNLVGINSSLQYMLYACYVVHKHTFIRYFRSDIDTQMYYENKVHKRCPSLKYYQVSFFVFRPLQWSTCCLRLQNCLKALPHTLHRWDFSVAWIFTCLVSFSFNAKPFPHVLQTWSLDATCMLFTCLFILLWLENFFWQILQTFSLSWSLMLWTSNSCLVMSLGR